jgi:hypothetical protein
MRLLSILLLGACLQAQSISTLIGTGSPGFDSSTVNNPYGMTIGPDDALYFCDIDNHVIRRIDLKTRAVETVVGFRREREFRGWRTSQAGQGRPAIRGHLRCGGQPDLRRHAQQRDPTGR